MLKKEQAGRVTFIPLNQVRAQNVNYPNVGDDALPLVKKLKFEARYKDAVHQARALPCTSFYPEWFQCYEHCPGSCSTALICGRLKVNLVMKEGGAVHVGAVRVCGRGSQNCLPRLIHMHASLLATCYNFSWRSLSAP